MTSCTHMASSPRFSAEPLVQFIARNFEVRYWVNADGQLINELDLIDTSKVRPSDNDIAEYLRVDRRTVMRLRHAGLSWMQADRYAYRVGVHPTQLWPDYYHDIVHSQEDQPCAATSCTRPSPAMSSTA